MDLRATLRLAVRHRHTGLSRCTHTVEYRFTDLAGSLESVGTCQVILGN